VKKKLFVIQPMEDMSEEDVYFVRQSILDTIGEDDWECVYNYRYPDTPYGSGGLWHLGKSVQKLEDADMVVTAPGWEKSVECQALVSVCMLYNIDVLDFERRFL